MNLTGFWGFGLEEAIRLDEYIPIVFAGLFNFYLLIPFFRCINRRYIVLIGIFFLLAFFCLFYYYIMVRYSPFKFFERVFEQAAPLSWLGNPLLWFQQGKLLDGMPLDRIDLVINGEWNAQFLVTYLISNSVIIGPLFLFAFSYFVGSFLGRALSEARNNGSCVLIVFLKLKLSLMFIEILGERVDYIDKLLLYIAAIYIIKLMFRMFDNFLVKPHSFP